MQRSHDDAERRVERVEKQEVESGTVAEESYASVADALQEKNADAGMQQLYIALEPSLDLVLKDLERLFRIVPLMCSARPVLWLTTS